MRVFQFPRITICSIKVVLPKYEKKKRKQRKEKLGRLWSSWVYGGGRTTWRNYRNPLSDAFVVAGNTWDWTCDIRCNARAPAVPKLWRTLEILTSSFLLLSSVFHFFFFCRALHTPVARSGGFTSRGPGGGQAWMDRWYQSANCRNSVQRAQSPRSL